MIWALWASGMVAGNLALQVAAPVAAPMSTPWQDAVACKVPSDDAKLTVPFSFPAPVKLVVTVAVKVTGAVATMGGNGLSVTEVGAWTTFWENGDEITAE